MYCRNCGREIRQDTRFCTYCGTEVLMPDVQQVEYGQEPQQYQYIPQQMPPEPVMPPEQKPKKSKKWIAFLILGIALTASLGAFGEKYFQMQQRESDEPKPTETVQESDAPDIKTPDYINEDFGFAVYADASWNVDTQQQVTGVAVCELEMDNGDTSGDYQMAQIIRRTDDLSGIDEDTFADGLANSESLSATYSQQNGMFIRADKGTEYFAGAYHPCVTIKAMLQGKLVYQKYIVLKSGSSIMTVLLTTANSDTTSDLLHMFVEY